MNLRGWKSAFLLSLTAILANSFSVEAVAEEPTSYVIDYVVFYTPEALANEEDGTVAAMNARIERAFTGANEIFRESKTGVQLRLVSAVKLSVNNSNTSLDTVISELTALPEVFEGVKAAGADSYALIVEQMLPGAYAGIPITTNQARMGGSAFFGRRNFSGFTFAHETGHTLGAFHDRPAEMPDSSDAPYGNHFVGNSGQHWRTVMSVKLNSYRAPEGQVIPTLQSNRFSSPDVSWDGVPTGSAGKNDVVSTIRYYAPMVSQAGERRAYVPEDNAPPPPVPTPDVGNEDPADGDEEIETPVEDLKPALSLEKNPSRNGNNVLIKTKCYYSNNGFAAVGKQLSLGYQEKGKQKLLKEVTCPTKGIATFKISKNNYRKGLTITYKKHPRVKVQVPFNKKLLGR